MEGVDVVVRAEAVDLTSGLGDFLERASQIRESGPVAVPVPFAAAFGIRLGRSAGSTG